MKLFGEMFYELDVLRGFDILICVVDFGRDSHSGYVFYNMLKKTQVYIPPTLLLFFFLLHIMFYYSAL